MSGNVFNRRSTRAKGSIDKRRPHMRQVAIQLDEETFNQAADLAFAKQISFAQLIREFIEWGMMDAEDKKAA